MIDDKAPADKKPPRRLMEALDQHEKETILPPNFHLVDEEKTVFRSGQPNRQQFIELATCYGCKTVLNARCRHSDESVLYGLEPREIRLRFHYMTQSDIVEALKIIRDCPRPVLVHCSNGADRTGVIIAAYRIVFCNWSLDDAMAEYLSAENGRHSFWYRRLAGLIRRCDWNLIARDVLGE